MREHLARGVLTLALAGAAAYFRALLAPLCVLALAMASDYATGVLAAWQTGTLSSRVGLLGIVKKLACLFGVGVAVAVDFVIRTAGATLGLELGSFCAFGLLVTVWLILNECLSVLENLAELGVPVPGFLQRIAARLKRSAEQTAGAAADNPSEPSCHPERSRAAAESKDPVTADRNEGKILRLASLAQDDNGERSGEAAPDAPEADEPSQSAAQTAPPVGEPSQAAAPNDPPKGGPADAERPL